MELSNSGDCHQIADTFMQVFEGVEDGEEWVITRQGINIAVMVPYDVWLNMTESLNATS